MKTRWVMVSLLVLCLMGGAVTANAGIMPGGGDPFWLIFDEQGVGFVAQSGNPNQFAFARVDANLSKTPDGALVWDLPEPVVSGDIVAYESPPTSTEVSDVLRFQAGGPNGSQMLFYSDTESTLPTSFSSNALFVHETGNEGDAVQTFEINYGYPGNNRYTAYSEGEAKAVPVPGAILLLGSGLAGLGFFRRLKRE